jgi:hypothetical protein
MAVHVNTPYSEARDAFTNWLSTTMVDSRFYKRITVMGLCATLKSVVVERVTCAVLNAMNKKKNPALMANTPATFLFALENIAGSSVRKLGESVKATDDILDRSWLGRLSSM